MPTIANDVRFVRFNILLPTTRRFLSLCWKSSSIGINADRKAVEPLSRLCLGASGQMSRGMLASHKCLLLLTGTDAYDLLDPRSW